MHNQTPILPLVKSGQGLAGDRELGGGERSSKRERKRIQRRAQYVLLHYTFLAGREAKGQ